MRKKQRNLSNPCLILGAWLASLKATGFPHLAITRRHLLQGSAAPRWPRRSGSTWLFPRTALAQAAPDGLKWRHGMSTFGDIKYPADFKRFDYVNPDAPKGGVARLFELGTYDSFNIVIAGLEGIGPRRRRHDLSIADGPGRSTSRTAITARLPNSSPIPDDFSYVIYRLRPTARWHDGKPVTPEDVIFSFEALKKHSPRSPLLLPAHRQGREDRRPRRQILLRQPRQSRTAADHGPAQRVAEALVGRHRRAGPQARRDRDHAGAAAGLRALSHQGVRRRPVAGARTGEGLLGQGSAEQHRPEQFRRAPLRILPRRRRRALEAFKADQFDWYAERSAKEWSVAYDFPAVHEKRVHQGKVSGAEFGPDAGLGLQPAPAAVQGRRLRRAFNFAFDFEEMNRTLSTGEYHRDNSYFDGIPDFMATGLPEGLELEILEPLRDKVPAEVFTTPYKNPVNGNPEAVRTNLREATRLLKEAGFEISDRKLVDPEGQPVSVEILVPDEGNERISLFYKPALERLGVTVSIRTVDDVQYQNRMRRLSISI